MPLPLSWLRKMIVLHKLSHRYVHLSHKKERKKIVKNWLVLRVTLRFGGKNSSNFQGFSRYFLYGFYRYWIFFATELIINDVSVIFLQGFYRQWSEEIHQIKCYEKFALQLEWNFRYSLNTVQRLPEIISACKL